LAIKNKTMIETLFRAKFPLEIIINGGFGTNFEIGTFFNNSKKRKRLPFRFANYFYQTYRDWQMEIETVY
jgi:hypothetical protein